MRESTVEKSFVKKVRTSGGVAYKFVSPGHIGVPDRLCLFQVDPADAVTVAKYVRFVELKAPGKKPRPSQVREMERLRKMGFSAYVVDSTTCI